MSSKKDKFLESAQKFIVKGQLDRAIKDYEQIIALDPNDIRHRQRLAELLVRVDRTVEAIGEYEAIGKYYADNGFYLKAIAVYKQVQKLDPEDVKTCLNLASLNEKQGLTGNALAEYGKVCSYYEKSGKRNDALTILESMIALDPDNLNTRLKIAEVRFTAGMADRSYEDFSQVASLLLKRGDESAFSQVSERVRYLFPEKKDFILGQLASQVKNGNAAAVIPRLQEITKREQDNLPAWHLLAEAFRSSGAREDHKLTLQKMARSFPDDLTATEELIRCALDENDIEGTFYLLKVHSATFAEKAAYQPLERIYIGLLNIAPLDVRVFEGLKELYEASGEQEKLAGIDEKMNSLGRFDAQALAGPPGSEVSSVDEQAVPLEAMAEPLMEEVGQPPLEEDEEIHLELPADENGGSGDLVSSREPALASGEATGGKAAPTEPEYPEEIDLELEISDDEFDSAEFSRGTDAEPEDSSSLTEEMGEPVVPDQEAFPESGASEQETFFEEGDVELETDFFSDIEAEQAAPPSSPDKYSPDELFSAFKKGLDQQLDKGDTETRYSLGIAFKEMGLYDEAISEFQAAAVDPQRRIDCLTLQGICFRDKGDFESAEELFKNGIGQEGLTPEEMLSIRYELALLCESAGRNEDALAMYRQIYAEQHDFRDTKEKIARLQGGEEFYDLDLVELESEDFD